MIEAVGAPVTTDASCTPQGGPGTDLHQLQQQLLLQNLRAHRTHSKIQLRGDGGVLALRADSPTGGTPLTVY
ncbi:MAG: hypothetical protein IPG64_27990 [Haliea sp.]|nr:hypothetical protein [Haliea sp.]